MTDFLRGRWSSSKELPNEIQEYMLATHFKWKLEYIRNLDYRDVQVLLLLIGIDNNIQRSEQIKMIKAGAPSMF